MSLRKVAGLLAAFGLTVGLIGGGVGATWTDQVTANQVLNIAPFSCAITAENGVGITPTHSITYTVPTIVHSTAGIAPFTFTVTNSGGVAMDLAVVAPAAAAPFAITPLTWDLSATNVASGASRVASTGVSWTDLTGYAGTGPYTFTWTVNCNETAGATAGATVTFTSVHYGSDFANTPGITFTGNLSGFNPGDIIDVQYSWDSPACQSWSPTPCPFDLSTYTGYGYAIPTADASGNATYSFSDNCHDGVQFTTDQNVIVTASDKHGHVANGTGILACSLWP
jgi:hypothetical protein